MDFSLFSVKLRQHDPNMDLSFFFCWGVCEEMSITQSLGSYWRMDITKVKGQPQFWFSANKQHCVTSVVYKIQVATSFQCIFCLFLLYTYLANYFQYFQRGTIIALKHIRGQRSSQFQFFFRLCNKEALKVVYNYMCQHYPNELSMFYAYLCTWSTILDHFRMGQTWHMKLKGVKYYTWQPYCNILSPDMVRHAVFPVPCKASPTWSQWRLFIYVLFRCLWTDINKKVIGTILAHGYNKGQRSSQVQFSYVCAIGKHLKVAYDYLCQHYPSEFSMFYDYFFTWSTTLDHFNMGQTWHLKKEGSKVTLNKHIATFSALIWHVWCDMDFSLFSIKLRQHDPNEDFSFFFCLGVCEEISIKQSLGSFWRMDITKVKSQPQFWCTNTSSNSCQV